MTNTDVTRVVQADTTITCRNWKTIHSVAIEIDQCNSPVQQITSPVWSCYIQVNAQPLYLVNIYTTSIIKSQTKLPPMRYDCFRGAWLLRHLLPLPLLPQIVQLYYFWSDAQSQCSLAVAGKTKLFCSSSRSSSISSVACKTTSTGTSQYRSLKATCSCRVGSSYFDTSATRT